MKLDEELGGFIRALKKDGLLDDTFIFYYGDHGGVLPRGKAYAYNNGLHVPMVVYVPDNFAHLAPAKNGSRVDGFVEFVDLSATVLALAGVTPPSELDGDAFLGKDVTLKELNSRDTAIGYADRFGEKYDLVRTIRKGRFTYMRNYQPFNHDGMYNGYRYSMLAYREWRDLYRQGKLDDVRSQFFKPRSPECLYDLDSDPDEVNNLADDPAHRATLLEMRGILQARVKDMADLGFIPESMVLTDGIKSPVAYGQKMKSDIARLVGIADLSLESFADARPAIEKALSSASELERYWGLITCSIFGSDAAHFYTKAKAMAASDSSSLVRTRAVEFLALTGQQKNPGPLFREILSHVDSPLEASLILNSATMLIESDAGYQIDLSDLKGSSWDSGNAKERLKYINNYGRK